MHHGCVPRLRKLEHICVCRSRAFSVSAGISKKKKKKKKNQQKTETKDRVLSSFLSIRGKRRMANAAPQLAFAYLEHVWKYFLRTFEGATYPIDHRDWRLIFNGCSREKKERYANESTSVISA
ncbi:hypothetical protein PUN28_016096 [Cardiocondyla obscurior]|uniref:Uncharacterized protein n=1 Tax=Cardiocondyla obscurior TaxID=286306 RepID=A0AAW2EUL2_9HYME